MTENDITIETYEIGVDSGQVLIADPYYFNLGEYDDLESEYRQCCNASLQREDNSYDHNIERNTTKGICVPSGWGDGCYTVEVHKRHGIVERVVIDFVGDDEDDYDDDCDEDMIE